MIDEYHFIIANIANHKAKPKFQLRHTNHSTTNTLNDKQTAQ